MGPKSCIGTTDTREEASAHRTCAPRTARFVLENINKRLRLKKPLTEADIIAERCGVRPLVVMKNSGTGSDADWTSLSRKHEIEVDEQRAHISVFGGKLTDCLNVGEEITRERARVWAWRCRTSATAGTASRPTRYATSSSTRRGSCISTR